MWYDGGCGDGGGCGGGGCGGGDGGGSGDNNHDDDDDDDDNNNNNNNNNNNTYGTLLMLSNMLQILSNKCCHYNTHSKIANPLDMVAKPTNAYNHTRVSYLINIVRLLHVSATLVAILRETHLLVASPYLISSMHGHGSLKKTPYPAILRSYF